MTVSPKKVAPLLLLVSLTALLVLSYACGGDGDGDREPAATFPARGGDGRGGKVETYDIAMNDNFFAPSEFALSGGVTVRFNISHPATAIHNLRVAGADNVYNNQDYAVSDPTLVNAGEVATLEWDTPAAGGTFDFRCDFHPQAMVGKITVQQTEGPSDGGQEGP